MGARTVHGKARRCRRIPHRVAPVVEGRGREFVRRAQLEMLRNFIDLDLRLDAHAPPHADDCLDDLVILGLESARRLNGEPHRIVRAVAGLGQQLAREIRVMRHLDGGVIGQVFGRLQRMQRHAVAFQQAVDDQFLVDRVMRREAHIAIQHRADIVDEQHADIRNRPVGAADTVTRTQAVVFLIGHFEGDMAVAALNLGDATRGIGDKADGHALELGRTAPVIGVGAQPDEGVALETLDHVGAGSDGRRLEALWADLLVVVPGQHIAGQEIHPLEDRRLEAQHVGSDAVAVDLEIADRGPDELDRVARLLSRGTFQRPHHILGRKGHTVMPCHAFAHIHPDLAVVLVPAPIRDQARLGAEIRRLADVAVEDGQIDALDRRVDRRGADRRVPAGQIHVIGDDQLVDVIPEGRKPGRTDRERRCGGLKQTAP